ncbi:MAG: Holliday junction branch migration protein RuvA [Alphaproteobacteria bacterium]|nr:Holliday junction branch migration protein RuvA [Alphaproteobacteria bacterium]
MIGKLRGIHDSSSADSVILDVSGVGYLVFASTQTLRALPSVGQEATLLIETHVREEYIHLYGFLSSDERLWFRHLFTVQGVGGRVALAILSALPLNQLINAIASEDKKMLSKADGVGPKLAVRIVTELREKARSYLGFAGISSKAVGGEDVVISMAGNNAHIHDAISALINLGYGRQDAFTIVHQQLQKQPDLSLDLLIKAALKELSQK